MGFPDFEWQTGRYAQPVGMIPTGRKIIKNKLFLNFF